MAIIIIKLLCSYLSEARYEANFEEYVYWRRSPQYNVLKY